MSTLFSRPSTPSAPKPIADTSAADSQAQADAARRTEAERLASGRQSTLAGGLTSAADDQYGKGFLAQQRRQSVAASQSILG